MWVNQKTTRPRLSRCVQLADDMARAIVPCSSTVYMQISWSGDRGAARGGPAASKHAHIVALNNGHRRPMGRPRRHSISWLLTLAPRSAAHLGWAERVELPMPALTCTCQYVPPEKSRHLRRRLGRWEWDERRLRALRRVDSHRVQRPRGVRHWPWRGGCRAGSFTWFPGQISKS